MVRAVKLQTNFSASYYNSSQGAFSSSATISSSSLTNGIVAVYNMDQWQGARLDGVGTNHLRGRLAPLGTSNGRINGALHLNGTANVYLSKTNNTLDFTGSFTIAAWTKLTDTNLSTFASGVLFSKTRDSYYLGYGKGYGGGLSSNTFNFGYKNASSIITYTPLQNAVASNVWYRVVAGYDAVNNVKWITVNNGTVVSNAQASAYTSTGNPAYVGTWEGLNNYWKGDIDEVVLWNRRLTPAEITEDYNNGLAGNAIWTSPIHVSVYAATNGLPNALGTTNDPTDIYTAFNRDTTRVQPGGTNYLMNSYPTNYAIQTNITLAVSGRSTNELVTFRSAPGAWANIDGVVDITGSNVVWRDLGSTEARVPHTDTNFWYVALAGQDTFDVHGNNVKIINSIFYNSSGDGFNAWEDAKSTLIYGNLMFNNGAYDPSQMRNRGHNIYMQNSDTNYPKQVEQNISVDAYDTGMHIFAVNGNLQGFNIQDNILYNSQKYILLVGGNNNPLMGVDVVSNLTYQIPSYNLPAVVLGYTTALNTNLSYRNNYNVGGGGMQLTIGYFTGKLLFTNNITAGYNQTLRMSYVSTNIFTNFTFAYNSYYSSEAGAGHDQQYDVVHLGTFGTYTNDTKLDLTSTATVGLPTNTVIKKLKNAYEDNRAYVAIVNWPSNNTVNVDLSGYVSPGANIAIIDPENVFTTITNFVYNGNPISFNMSWTTNGPLFGAFMVLPYPTRWTQIQTPEGEPPPTPVVELSRPRRDRTMILTPF